MSSLLRSTKLVRYFTGAARTLILNSAKTADAALLINPKAITASNNVLMRDYASKKSESLDPLLQKLDLEVRKFGRITKKDIDEVFDELRANHDITSSQSLLVIRCCGDLVPEELPEQRTLLVQKIWNVLTERGIPMDVSHYNALLRVYIENEHPFSPAQFLEEMEKKGLQPNRVTYQRLMWRYCQEGDVDGATKVLEKMRELNMPVSEPVLNALIMGHAFHGDTDGAKAVLDTMSGAGLKPSNRTYALLACGYAKQGDMENVDNVITSAIEQDNPLTDKDLLDIVEQLAIGGHEDKVEDIFQHLHKAVGYNQEACSLILRLLNKDHEVTAKKVMKTMPKIANSEDTIFKGAFYVKHLLKVKQSADGIIQSLRELQNEGLIVGALYIATEAALQQGRTELAEKLFKELKKDGVEIRQHYYWPLLVQKVREDDEEGLLEIIRNMCNEGLPPTGEALRDYVIPYMIKKNSAQNVIVKLQLSNVPTFHSARNIMIELLDLGDMKKAADIASAYHPRGQYALIRRPLLNAFSKTKDIDSLVNIIHVTSSNHFTQQENGSNEDIQIDDQVHANEVGRIVRSCINIVARDNITETLLSKLLSKGLRISTVAAEEIQQHLGKNMTTEISELLTKLTSPDLEMAPLGNAKRVQGVRTTSQLEKLLEQVESKDGNHLNRLRKQLLVAYINERNVEKVAALVEEFKTKSDFELTAATMAQLFEFYCENDEIDKAYEIKAQLFAKDPKFELNNYKKVQLAYALVRANRYDEAINFLIENKVSSDTENTGFTLNSKSWQMLNNLAETKDDSKVKEMTTTLIDNGYIEPSNVILGPLIKVHLLKDDIESALKEFENCCQQYRSTPWKGELMKALILKEDATKLQWLADLSTQIHGEVNILHDLVLAFVECGRLRQARRILETPGLQTRQRRLTDACQRYVEEGKSEYLEGLLEATKELSHIDRSNIFYHLLVSYCKANETDKALGLWTLLQEEGEVPSEQFLMHLGSHLKQKNREVPFVIPHAKVAPKPVSKPIAIKKKAEDAEKPLKKDVTAEVEKLTQEGKTIQAMDVAMKSIEAGVFPKPNVLKYLLRTLAEEGNVEKIQALGPYIGDTMRRNVTYEDKLTLAIFKRGVGVQHVDNVLKALQAAKTDEEVERTLRKFPRSNALATAVQDEELAAKCHQLVELAASKGYVLPANLLWMEYLLIDNIEEAESLWKKYLQDASVVVFRRLLQECHTKRDAKKIEYLIDTLKSSKKISPTSIGNAYSRLINLHLVENKLDEANNVFDRALKSGITVEHLNKTSIKRLKDASEAAGQELDIV